MHPAGRLTRRDMIRGSIGAAALGISQFPLRAFAYGAPAEGETLIPFLDPQPINPDRPMLVWHELEDWITPTANVFSVGHYPAPDPIDPADWRLEISGLVDNPLSLSLADLKARPRVEHVATIECSGNGASPRFMGAVGNARWAGTPLAPILKECGLKPEAIEFVFFGRDEGTETIREKEYQQNFARSLGLEDALDDTVLLAWEMNGQPLEHGHGAPVRLVVPGWFAVAWVKWLARIEVHDRRYMGRFMGRDYVTIRGEQRGDQTIWRETSVGRIDIKSIVARVVRRADGGIRVTGAAWNDGTPLKAVELKIDDGSWIETEIDREHHAKYAWSFWSYEWKSPTAGEHTLVSRAIDTAGRVQPAADDPVIALKRTYWEANQQVPRRIEV